MTTIQTTTYCQELQITGILDKIDEYRRNWFQHLQRVFKGSHPRCVGKHNISKTAVEIVFNTTVLQRVPQNRIPLISYYYRPQGRRTIGRPKKRWREQLLFWRRNGSKGPILDVYDDNDHKNIVKHAVFLQQCKRDAVTVFLFKGAFWTSRLCRSYLQGSGIINRVACTSQCWALLHTTTPECRLFEDHTSRDFRLLLTYPHPSLLSCLPVPVNPGFYWTAP